MGKKRGTLIDSCLAWCLLRLFPPSTAIINRRTSPSPWQGLCHPSPLEDAIPFGRRWIGVLLPRMRSLWTESLQREHSGVNRLYVNNSIFSVSVKHSQPQSLSCKTWMLIIIFFVCDVGVGEGALLHHCPLVLRLFMWKKLPNIGLLGPIWNNRYNYNRYRYRLQQLSVIKGLAKLKWNDMLKLILELECGEFVVWDHTIAEQLQFVFFQTVANTSHSVMILKAIWMSLMCNWWSTPSQHLSFL